MRVLVAGLGKLGSVMAALIADADNEVVGVDPNPDVLWAINERRSPNAEPGLAELLAGLPDGRLVVTDNYAAAVDQTDIAMIVVPTPSRTAGDFDPRFVVDAVTGIGRYLAASERSEPYLVVVCSTLSPGTMGDVVAPALEQASGLTVGSTVRLAYSPEFIALGTIIADMRKPDMVLVGASDTYTAVKVAAVSATFRRDIDVSTKMRAMSYTEAELVKLSINGYLSIKVGYANMIGAAAQRMGCDPEVVLSAIGSDARIGTGYLHKGGPPSGPCLPRDLVALEALGTDIDVPMTLATAARQTARDVVTDILAAAGVNKDPIVKATHRTIAILGVAYKAGSPVTDDSLAQALIARTAMHGLSVTTYDPHASLPGSWQNRQCDSVEAALEGADTVIIACPHPEFEGLDFGDRKVINPWR